MSLLHFINQVERKKNRIMNDDEIRKNWGDFVTGNPSTLQDKPASTWGAATFRCKTIQSLPCPVKEGIIIDGKKGEHKQD